MSIMEDCHLAATGYYIRHAGYVGNCLIFWKSGAHGYTTHIHEAWLVSKEEAERICQSRPNEDFPMAAEVVHAAATMQVDCEKVPR